MSHKGRFTAQLIHLNITHCNDFCTPLMSQVSSTCISAAACPSVGQDNCSNDSQAIHHPTSKCEMSHVIRTWQENQAIATQVWQMCAGWRDPPPRWQRQRLALRRWQTDKQQIVSETPFRDRDHTHDRWDGGSSRVSRAREDGQPEGCAEALEGMWVKLNKKQIKDSYILQVCVHASLRVTSDCLCW